MKSSEETTWLFHELGRCKLELGDCDEAREYGKKSLAAAGDIEDRMWQLNASVLVAQAESELCAAYGIRNECDNSDLFSLTAKLGELQAAVQSFERSLELARLLGDEASQLAIKKAMEEVNTHVVEGLKPEGEGSGGENPGI